MKISRFSAVVAATVAIMAVSGCGNGGSSNSTSVALAQADPAIIACTNTANSYAYSRDRLDFATYGSLFTENAKFIMPGKDGKTTLNGRDAIVNAAKQRGGNTETRHVSQVVDMQKMDDNTLRGVSYLVFYGVPKADFSDGQASISGPRLVAEYHDEFTIENGMCKFTSREVKIVFTQVQ